MGLTLKAKLFLVTGASVITIAMLAFGAISSTSTFADVLKRSNAATVALRNHTVADMMHDAIRADVYRAFFVATKFPDSRKIVVADVMEHAAAFRSLEAANERLPLPSEVRSALTQVEKPLESYISASIKLVETVFEDDRKAEALLADFEKQFSALKVAMDGIGDKIEDFAKTEATDAEAFASLAKRLSQFGLLLDF